MKKFEVNITSVSFVQVKAHDKEDARKIVGENLEDYIDQIQDNVEIGENVNEIED